MSEQEQLAWSSFMPALMACLGATDGPILELGVGHFSTPTLHAYCGAAGRELSSVEHDKDWFLKIADKFASKHHHMSISEDYGIVEYLGTIGKFSVSFIDHSPGGKNRADAFKFLIDTSEYVVVHDYEKDNEEHIAPLLSGVKYKHITKTYQPPTLVASMFKEIPKSILCL